VYLEVIMVDKNITLAFQDLQKKQAAIDNIFLSFKYEDDLKESEFIDNYTIDNERLRNLINEINDCRFILDKIAMVKEEVNSLSDLMEVLSVCFWEDEALELFKTLSKEEI
jgi:hypothetical protein